MTKKDRLAKCEAILKRMLELANEGKPVTLSEDWGDYTVTLRVGRAHTHCVGIPSYGTWDQLVEELYNSLHGGPGLSWYDPKPPKEKSDDGPK